MPTGIGELANQRTSNRGAPRLAAPPRAGRFPVGTVKSAHRDRSPGTYSQMSSPSVGDRRSSRTKLYAPSGHIKSLSITGSEEKSTGKANNSSAPVTLLPAVLTPSEVAAHLRFTGRPDKVMARLERAGLRVLRIGHQARVLREDLEAFVVQLRN